MQLNARQPVYGFVSMILSFLALSHDIATVLSMEYGIRKVTESLCVNDI